MDRTWKTTALAAALVAITCGAALAQDKALPEAISAPVTDASGIMTLRGIVTRSNLEGGFYTVAGWALKGDQTLYAGLAGQEVVVKGKEFTGIDTWMTKSVVVESIARLVDSAGLPQPAAVTVSGRTVAFDQGPVVIDGVLMVPLRAVAEAAGGFVHWDGSSRTAMVTLPDRRADFVIGEARAEMNENGVHYFARNLLPMAKAPVLLGGRTLISAETLSQILGLAEHVDGDQNLDLLPWK